MKKPLLIFTLKCSIILYFVACTGINDNAGAVAATPYVTKGTWKVNLVTHSNNDETAELSGYLLNFDVSGKITASKNGKVVTGNWAEDEIQKRITINLDTKDPDLTILNAYWNISTASSNRVSLKNTENPSKSRLLMTSL